MKLEAAFKGILKISENLKISFSLQSHEEMPVKEFISVRLHI